MIMKYARFVNKVKALDGVRKKISLILMIMMFLIFFLSLSKCSITFTSSKEHMEIKSNTLIVVVDVVEELTNQKKCPSSYAFFEVDEDKIQYFDSISSKIVLTNR